MTLFDKSMTTLDKFMASVVVAFAVLCVFLVIYHLATQPFIRG